MLMSTSSTDDPGDDLEGGEALLTHVDLDLLVIEAPLTELLAQLLARPLRLLADRRGLLVVVGGGRQRRQQQVQHPFLGRLLRLAAHFGEPLLLDHVDRQLDEVAHHRLHVAPDVADLGELRRFDLDERGLREPRQPARDLGLADARRADHQDVLRRDLLGELRRQLLPAHAIAQRDGDGALGLALADHVFVELGDDLTRREGLRGRRGGLWKIDGHSG